MGIFTGVLLVSDYDDTLYDHSFSISSENRAAIQRFIDEGGLFTIATGRSFLNFAIQMDQENLPVNAPVVLTNGSAIYDFQTQKTLWEKTLPTQVIDDIQAVVSHFPQIGFEAYHNHEVYTFRPNRITEQHLNRCHLTGLLSPIEEMPLPFLKIIFQHENTELLSQVQDYVKASFPSRYEISFSNHTLLELTAQGANKGHAVQWLRDYLNIAPQHLYCVGNGMNDISMLALSAIPFAPSDSYDEVLRFGAAILPSCNENCVAALIEQLEKRYQDTCAFPLRQ